ILKKGGVLIADNVLYKGMVASGELETFRKKTLVKNLRDFLYEISNDGCFTTSILPIGDGISVSYYNN
ncbi:MAG: O-methyltransferase, partial [Clostridia bacterium]|nr:O-methyltransferase [Clostridia bacterium]